MKHAAPHLPLGWQTAPGADNEVDILYSLRLAPPAQREGQRNYHLLYCGSALLARHLELPPVLTALEKHAELLTALRAQDCLFVHAGAVGWQGQAILIPGRSMTGKTTLVKALVEAGATYYSDEFAVLDKEGRVHPYPVPLSMRDAQGRPVGKIPVAELNGQVGEEPLPVGLVVVTHYQRRARWRPQELSPAQGLLRLLDNTVAARREPQYTMPILKLAALNAKIVESKRGDAKRIAPALLELLP